MKTSLKDKLYNFLFGAEGINQGDCVTYSYETILWGLVIWFATFDKIGVPLVVFFIFYAALMAWMWGTYLKVKKEDERLEAEEEAKKEKS